MVSKILIVDDDRIRHENFAMKFRDQYPDAQITHVYTYKNAIGALESAKYDLIQLDHDLMDFGPYPDTDPIKTDDYEYIPPKGQKEYTGTDIALFMAQSKFLLGEGKPDMVKVHSWNTYGAKRMADILKDSGFTVFIELFKA